MCQGLTSEDEVEAAADEGFDCSLCRTHSRGSYGENTRMACWGLQSPPLYPGPRQRTLDSLPIIPSDSHSCKRVQTVDVIVYTDPDL